MTQGKPPRKLTSSRAARLLDREQKLAMIGGFVGPVGVVQTIVVASLAGLGFGIGWAVLRRGLDTPFGFGPMLARGALVTVLWPVPLAWFAPLS